MVKLLRATTCACVLLLSLSAACWGQPDIFGADLPAASAPAQSQTEAPPGEAGPPSTPASSPTPSRDTDVRAFDAGDAELSPALTRRPSPAPASPLSGLEAGSKERPSNSGGSAASCPPYFDTQRYRTTNFTDFLNTTVAISPKRPPANVPVGEWIQGRATFYGSDARLEASRVACGEPAGQFGVLAQGSCGYTNSDGSLPFPKEVYAAVADTNEDYPGSCGRCYEVRCRTGAPFNNGRPMRISDLIYYRPYQIKDNQGRDWPGNPQLEEDVFYTKCWDDDKSVIVRIGDSCPCRYPIKETGEIRTQNWCCGGNNHLDLSFFAFEQLAHPSFGVMPIQYRPVDCDSGTPLRPVPGFVNQTIYGDSIEAGWTWMPYNAKNTVLLAQRQGVGKSNATCGTLSQGGAMQFLCRQCSRPGYQPFAKAKTLRFDIRSNTKSADPFVSSTPPGELPALKVFLMNANLETYCGAEVVLSSSNSTATGNGTLIPVAEYATRTEGDWYRVTIPLSTWACDRGSVGSLARVDRVDFQNTNIRDAEVCLDNIALV